MNAIDISPMTGPYGSLRDYLRHPRRGLVMLLYLPFVLLLRATPWRFMCIKSRIGDMVIQVDWFLKRQALGELPSIRPILFFDDDPRPNAALVKAWARHIPVAANPFFRALIFPLTHFPGLRFDLRPAVYTEPVDYPRVAKAWAKRPPFLTLSEEVRTQCERNLRDMGVPSGAWFVCVNARDNVYTPGADPQQTARNCDIANCEKAVDEILARGGWCLRMGEPHTKPLQARAGVINYPDTAFKSDAMDLYLGMNARFFLGNSSGIYTVSTAAGVPSALANMIPLGTCYGFGARDISIVKFLRDEAGRTLHFGEIFASYLSRLSYFAPHAEKHIPVENTADEIRDLAVEMLDVLDGRMEYTAEDEALQQAFRSLMNERHYTYGAPGRIGRNFLRQNAHLLTAG